MFTALYITAAALVVAYAKLATPSGRQYIKKMSYEGRQYIKKMSYEGRHNLKPTRAERQWVGEPAPRVVYTSLKTQWN